MKDKLLRILNELYDEINEEYHRVDDPTQYMIGRADGYLSAYANCINIVKENLIDWTSCDDNIRLKLQKTSERNWLSKRVLLLFENNDFTIGQYDFLLNKWVETHTGDYVDPTHFKIIN